MHQCSKRHCIYLNEVAFGYMQRREAGRRTYVNMMSGENKVSWPVKDLIPNGEYYFRVQAVNKIGGGEFIELRNPVIAEDQKRKQMLRHNMTDDTIRYMTDDKIQYDTI